MAIKLAISGAGGKMGKRLLALSDADQDFTLVQAIEWTGFPDLGKPINQTERLAPRSPGVMWSSRLVPGADVLIDFSSPDNTADHAHLAAKLGIPMIAGTTGLNREQEAVLHDAAKRIPMLHAPNFSLGVNLLFQLVAEAAKALGAGYDVEIVEAHHNQKADAPSGTALGLATAVAVAKGLDLGKEIRNGRQGKPGARTPDEIGMHALRMGSVVGDHTVYFASPFERIELSHHAESRDVFVVGALRAAKWLVGKQPGKYTMRDCLFG